VTPATLDSATLAKLSQDLTVNAPARFTLRGDPGALRASEAYDCVADNSNRP
jgi:hypothetical protein